MNLVADVTARLEGLHMKRNPDGSITDEGQATVYRILHCVVCALRDRITDGDDEVHEILNYAFDDYDDTWVVDVVTEED